MGADINNVLLVKKKNTRYERVFSVLSAFPFQDSFHYLFQMIEDFFNLNQQE